MTTNPADDDATALAEAVLADPNTPVEVANKARAVLARRRTAGKTPFPGALPDGHPVHEAAKTGAHTAFTDADRKPQQ